MWSAYQYDKYAKIRTPTGPHFADGAMVPCSCTWAWAWLGWLRRLAGGGHSAVAPYVVEAIKADILPALDEDQADMFTPSELRLYQHAQDHRLLTRWDDYVKF